MEEYERTMANGGFPMVNMRSWIGVAKEINEKLKKQ